MVLNFATYTALAFIYLLRGIDIDDPTMFVFNFGVSIIVLYYILESILYCCCLCFCRDQKCGLYIGVLNYLQLLDSEGILMKHIGLIPR